MLKLLLRQFLLYETKLKLQTGISEVDYEGGR
jgi:hypothetical protein